jgi:hypothetical protein
MFATLLPFCKSSSSSSKYSGPKPSMVRAAAQMSFQLIDQRVDDLESAF